MKKKIIAIIPARGGSKLIPKKNIIKLGNKPIIAWTIEAAKKSKYINKIIVTTEDGEIRKQSLKYGAEVPFKRPISLATDKIHSVFPTLHVIEWLAKNKNYHPDIVIMLLPTAPLRRPIDIDKAIVLHLKNKNRPVIGVCESSKQLLHFRYIKNQKLVALIKSKTLNVQRQDLKKLYYVNGSIYIARTKDLLKEKTFHLKNAIPYIMDKEYSIDINTKKDLNRAKLILKLKNNKNGKIL